MIGAMRYMELLFGKIGLYTLKITFIEIEEEFGELFVGWNPTDS